QGLLGVAGLDPPADVRVGFGIALRSVSTQDLVDLPNGGHGVRDDEPIDSWESVDVAEFAHHALNGGLDLLDIEPFDRYGHPHDLRLAVRVEVFQVDLVDVDRLDLLISGDESKGVGALDQDVFLADQRLVDQVDRLGQGVFRLVRDEHGAGA